MKVHPFLTRVFSSKYFLIIGLILLFSAKGYSQLPTSATMTNPRVRVLFTTDLHSCAKQYPYLATFIKERKEAAKKEGLGVITLDAGDFSMGTLYSIFYELNATEYRALALMGYDAFIFGNHDFDVGLKSTAYMVYNSRILGHELNPITKKPLEFPTNITANIGAGDNETFANALKYLNHSPYIIIPMGGIKIGVFGLLGKDAYNMTNVVGELDYLDPIETAKKIIPILKEKKVDYIIALSHSGSLLREKSEDFKLAKECPDIDLIISGHDHEAIFQPLTVGDTKIVSAGTGGYLVGELELRKDSYKTRMTRYRLAQISDTLAVDPEAKALFDTLDVKLVSFFNKRYKISPDYIVTNQHDVSSRMEGGIIPLNYEIAKSYFWALTTLPHQMQVDSSKLISVVPSGFVRSSLPQKDITYEDVFNVVPLGRDSWGNPGYPLICCYLTGRELKNLCEVNASVSQKLPDAYLTFYGLNYHYNSKGIIFRRVKDLFVHGQKVENDMLYPVVTDLYTANSIALIKEKSKGILKVQPKDKNGSPVNLNKCIVSATHIPNISNSDLTAWLAYSFYLRDNVELGDKYLPNQIDYPSSTPLIILVISGLLLILLLSFVIYYFVSRRNKKKDK